MIEKLNQEELKKILPYWFYSRITLTTSRYMPVTTTHGFYYLVRQVIVKWAELDNAGLQFNNNLRIEFVDTTGNKPLQNNPIPPALFTTPGSSGVRMNATGHVTATGVSSAIIFNHVLAPKSVLQMFVSGNGAAWPAWIDVLVMGYTIKGVI